MRFEEYRKHDAVSLAGLIAKRQVSAKEVLEVAIGRATGQPCHQCHRDSNSERAARRSQRGSLKGR